MWERLPWVRAGVGAVAAQVSTLAAYGNELFDMIAAGLTADDALSRAVGADVGATRRQVVSQTLGFRELRIDGGSDIWQLRVILHALG